MSRFVLFRKSVAASYALLATNIVYTLASVPLLLGYLSKEEFGLWATASQILTFITLLDLGTNASMARLLIDHKDDPAGASYGSLIKAGIIVGGTQSVLIFFAGLLLVKPMATWIGLEQHLFATFRELMLMFLVVSCATFACRITNQLLQAWQRLDIQYLIAVGQLAIAFAGLWLGLVLGFGIYATAFGMFCGALFSVPLSFAACSKLRLWPQRGRWGSPTIAAFQAIFGFGLDLFIISLSTQAILASQTILIARYIGLEAAATWSVMTKMFILLSQALWRLVSNAVPAFAEMHVRAESSALRSSVRLLSVGIGVLAGVASVIFATTNGLFVQLWTDGRVTWHFINNIMLGLWLIILTQLSVTNSLLICFKQTKILKYVYMLEAVGFVFLSAALVGSFGISGVLAASIVCTVFCTWLYGLISFGRTLGISPRVYALSWQTPGLIVVSVLVLVALALSGHVSELGLGSQLWIYIVVLSTTGVITAVRFALPKDIRDSIRADLPHGLRFLLPA